MRDSEDKRNDFNRSIRQRVNRYGILKTTAIKGEKDGDVTKPDRLKLTWLHDAHYRRLEGIYLSIHPLKCFFRCIRWFTKGYKHRKPVNRQGSVSTFHNLSIILWGLCVILRHLNASLRVFSGVSMCVSVGTLLLSAYFASPFLGVACRLLCLLTSAFPRSLSSWDIPCYTGTNTSPRTESAVTTK